MQHVWLGVGGVDCPYFNALCGRERSRVATRLRPPGGQDVFYPAPVNGVTLDNKPIRSGYGRYKPNPVYATGKRIAKAFGAGGVVRRANKQTRQQYAHTWIFRLDRW